MSFKLRCATNYHTETPLKSGFLSWSVVCVCWERNTNLLHDVKYSCSYSPISSWALNWSDHQRRSAASLNRTNFVLTFPAEKSIIMTEDDRSPNSNVAVRTLNDADAQSGTIQTKVNKICNRFVIILCSSWLLPVTHPTTGEWLVIVMWTEFKMWLKLKNLLPQKKKEPDLPVRITGTEEKGDKYLGVHWKMNTDAIYWKGLFRRFFVRIQKTCAAGCFIFSVLFYASASWVAMHNVWSHKFKWDHKPLQLRRNFIWQYGGWMW